MGSDYWAVSAAYAPGAAPAPFLWEPRAYFGLPDDLLDLWRTLGLDPVAARAASGYRTVLVSWRDFEYVFGVWGSPSPEETARIRAELKGRPECGLYRLR